MLFSSYAGTSEDRMMLLAQEAFDNVMRPSLYPGARSLVEKSRAAGHDVVLVSGALTCVLDRLADYFGGAEVIGNRLEMKDGIATGKLLKPVVAGPEKARLIREHAGAKGYSDVPMLSVVGHPAAVNPDKRLSWLAKAYGWPSFDLSRAA